MRAGTLRHQVTIKYKVVVQDSYGQEVITWTELDTVWASIEPLLGREYMAAQQVQAEISHRVRIRALSGVAPTMRVYFGSRVFDIRSVQNVEERDREMVLYCTEAISD